MAIQLQRTATDNVGIPLSREGGYTQPSLQVLSCQTCNTRSNCVVKQLNLTRVQSYQPVKNRRVLSKGSHVFRGGDEAKAIYVVSRGSIKSYMLMEDGEEQVLNFYMPGDVFGLEAMGGGGHISSTVTLETTTVCMLPMSKLRDRVLGQNFLNVISTNLLRDHNQMLMLARKDAEGRLASFILDMLKRVDREHGSDNAIKLTMTRQDIANYLGQAIETVCRTLRKFQDGGILKVTRRTVEIYDYDGLLKIAGSQIAR
jgi:CRP/FNR family transcriptional regulator, anaerobic regulatory protein